MLTKRVFNAIVKQLKQVRPVNPEQYGVCWMPVDQARYETWVSAVVAMGRGLEESNPRFDSGRFLAACKEE